MTERVDYKFDKDFNLKFTNGAYETVDDGDVVLQDAVLLIAEETSPLVGEQVTATKLSRYRQRVERRFVESDTIESYQFVNFKYSDGELSFEVFLNGTEFDETITLT